MGPLDALGEFSHGLFRVGRNVRAYRVRIDQEQIKRRVEVVEKVNDTSTSAFSRALPTPPNFTDPSSVSDNVASLGISGYEINEGFPLLIAPNIAGLALEGERFGDGYGIGQHLHNIRQWRTSSREMLRDRPPLG